MGVNRGQFLQAVIYREATYGVAPTTPNGLRLPLISCGIAMKRTLVQSRLLNASRNAAEPDGLGRKDVSGPLVIRPDSRSIAFLAQDILGTTATAVDTPSAGLDKHTTKVAALPVGLTLDRHHTDSGDVFRTLGIRINEWTINPGDEGALEMSMNCIGADVVEDSALLDAGPKYYDPEPLLQPTLTITEGGSAIKILKDFSLTVANNLDEEVGRTIGNGGARVELPEGTIGVAFNFNALFTSKALLTKAKNQTQSSLAITFPAKTTASHSFAVQIKELLYEVQEPVGEGPNGLVVPMRGVGFWKADAANSCIYFETINDIASVAAIPAS